MNHSCKRCRLSFISPALLVKHVNENACKSFLEACPPPFIDTNDKPSRGPDRRQPSWVTDRRGISTGA